MNFEYFDIHSHLYFSSFDVDREAEIAKIKEAKIGAISIGIDFESSQKAISLSEGHENLFASVGQHPGDIFADAVFDSRLESIASDEKVLAIGECGLDYFRLFYGDYERKPVQKKIFQDHIDLALKLDKPMMLHVRPSNGTMDAYKDALEILENQFKVSGDKLRGNVHFFVGSVEILKRFLALGFTVSFTGVITFTQDYDQLIKYVPLDMVMSETDTPFVAPVPHRGGRNSPLYIPEVIKRIADIRGENFEDVKIALCNNALRCFMPVAPKPLL